jgi:hypothetical protein
MLTGAFDNCGESIREYQRCVHWLWPICIHFDIDNDAWRDPVSIHVARGAPKCVSFLVSHVKLFFILAEQKLFCFNQLDHESEQQRRAEDTAMSFAGDST